MIGAHTETALVLAELYLRDTEWKCRAVGQGWDNGLAGLAGLATDYGITIEDTPEMDGPVEAEAGLEDASDTLVELVAEEQAQPDLSTEPADLPADATGEPDVLATPPSQALAAVVPLPRSETPIAPATPRARAAQGVRTKKRSTSSSLPALTLAGDKNWQSARLFSVSGKRRARIRPGRELSQPNRRRPLPSGHGYCAERARSLAGPWHAANLRQRLDQGRTG